MLKAPILNPEPPNAESQQRPRRYLRRQEVAPPPGALRPPRVRARGLSGAKSPKQNVLGLIVGVESPRFEKEGLRV